MDFWGRCREIMREKEINQSDISRALCVGDTTVSYWIRRKAIPRADDALKLADRLGVSLRYLITGADKDMSIELMEIVDICRGMNKEELSVVIRMLKGLEKRDAHESDMVVG